jgi:lipopolysaccharide/colanic/teichoic acid biosynthesis glycosyltransferase
MASAIVHLSNPVFMQERIGKDGKLFTLYKIKTMRDAFDSMTGRPLPPKERTTRFGEFLRKTKCDELLQLINVLKGDMSLVGPRPYLPENETAHNPIRQEVKPGITGLQQIKGGNSLSYEFRLQVDIQYVRNRNFFLDLGILFATIPALFKQRNEPHFGKDTDDFVQRRDTSPDK